MHVGYHPETSPETRKADSLGAAQFKAFRASLDNQTIIDRLTAIADEAEAAGKEARAFAPHGIDGRYRAVYYAGQAGSASGTLEGIAWRLRRAIAQMRAEGGGG